MNKIDIIIYTIAALVLALSIYIMTHQNNLMDACNEYWIQNIKTSCYCVRNITG